MQRWGFALLAMLTIALAACTQPTNPTEDDLGGTITVTASSATMEYGDAVPTITPSYSGFGETQTETPPTCATTATSTSPPGTYETFCLGAVHGTAVIMYVAGSLTITRAPVTVTASNASFAFGGSVPTITASYSGLKNGDTEPDVLPICGTDATSSSPNGSYDSTCSGADDPNYTFSYVDGTVSVGSSVVTVTASSGSSTYGGAAPTITAVYSGLLNGDTEPATPATCGTNATSSSPAGSYVSTCSGAADPNYTFNYVNGTVTVNKAAAVVTASSATVAFTGAIPPITPSYSGLVNGDTAPATSPMCSTPATSSSSAGSYPSSCSGAADPDYTFTYVGGTITITMSVVPVTVTASSATITYGADVPDVTASYFGFLGGQTVPDTLATCTTTATDSSPAGTYPTSCSGAADSSYGFAYVGGTIMIQPKAATVTASSGSFTYGGSVPTITASYSGLVNGDTAPTTLPTCSTTATSSSDAGSYLSLCAGAADPSYTFTAVPGTVSIGKKALTVTASSGTKVYGAAVSAITPAYAGLVNGDLAPASAPACSTTATSASPVGSYVSTCSGANDANYTFTYVDGTITVTKAAATITAASVTTFRGTAVPAITPVYSGLVAGDTATATPPVCSTTATSSSPVGSYPSTCSGASDPNYTLSYVAGVVTVQLPTLTITAPSVTLRVGDAVPTLAPIYTGLVAGDTAPATPATCSTAATTAAIGRFGSACVGASDPNYNIVYVSGTVMVSPSDGYGEYKATAHTTTLSTAVANINTTGTLTAVNPQAAGFTAFTNLTVATTNNGPQHQFCRTANTTQFGTCAANGGGSGNAAVGAYITDAPMHRFQVSTVAGPGVNVGSLAIVQDVAASNRGTPSRATPDGIVTYLQSGAPSGSFDLTYGICKTGTATYTANDPNCATGVIHYSVGVTSYLGDDVGPVFGVTTNTYQSIDSAVTAPSTVAAGSNVTVRIAPASGAVPRAQSASGVTATVNTSSVFASYYPIPAGFTYVSHRLIGGDLTSATGATSTYCTALNAGGNCDARTASGQYVGNSAPYVAMRLATGNVAGGRQMTMPTVELTLQATGTPGVIGNVTMMQYRNVTNATAIIVTTDATFEGYPTTGNADNVPPVAPANVLKSITIT